MPGLLKGWYFHLEILVQGKVLRGKNRGKEGTAQQQKAPTSMPSSGFQKGSEIRERIKNRWTIGIRWRMPCLIMRLIPTDLNVLQFVQTSRRDLETWIWERGEIDDEGKPN